MLVSLGAWECSSLEARASMPASSSAFSVHMGSRQGCPRSQAAALPGCCARTLLRLERVHISDQTLHSDFLPDGERLIKNLMRLFPVAGLAAFQ